MLPALLLIIPLVGAILIGFLPAHRPDVVGCQPVLANVRVLIDYLLDRTG